MAIKPLPSPNVEREDAAVGVVDKVPHPNYQLAYNPADWQITSAGRLQPVFVQIPRKSGVNGYRGHDKASIDRRRWAKAQAQAEAQGLVFIEHDVLSEFDTPDYVTPYLTTDGRVTHRSIFAEPVDMGPQQATKWEHDAEGWSSFIDVLRAKGIIEPPSPGVVRNLLTLSDIEGSLLAKQRPEPSAPHYNLWDRRMRAKEAERAMLERELAISVAHYDEKQAPTMVQRKSLRAKLHAALAEEVTSKVPASSKPKVAIFDESPAKANAEPSQEAPKTLVDLCAPLSLPGVAIKALEEMGATSAEDLLSLDDNDWLGLPQVGPARMESIRKGLEVLRG